MKKMMIKRDLFSQYIGSIFYEIISNFSLGHYSESTTQNGYKKHSENYKRTARLLYGWGWALHHQAELSFGTRLTVRDRWVRLIIKNTTLFSLFVHFFYHFN